MLYCCHIKEHISVTALTLIYSMDFAHDYFLSLRSPLYICSLYILFLLRDVYTGWPKK